MVPFNSVSPVSVKPVTSQNLEASALTSVPSSDYSQYAELMPYVGLVLAAPGAFILLVAFGSISGCGFGKPPKTHGPVIEPNSEINEEIISVITLNGWMGGQYNVTEWRLEKAFCTMGGSCDEEKGLEMITSEPRLQLKIAWANEILGEQYASTYGAPSLGAPLISLDGNPMMTDLSTDEDVIARPMYSPSIYINDPRDGVSYIDQVYYMVNDPSKFLLTSGEQALLDDLSEDCILRDDNAEVDLELAGIYFIKHQWLDDTAMERLSYYETDSEGNLLCLDGEDKIQCTGVRVDSATQAISTNENLVDLNDDGDLDNGGNIDNAETDISRAGCQVSGMYRPAWSFWAAAVSGSYLDENNNESDVPAVQLPSDGNYGSQADPEKECNAPVLPIELSVSLFDRNASVNENSQPEQEIFGMSLFSGATEDIPQVLTAAGYLNSDLILRFRHPTLANEQCVRQMALQVNLCESGHCE